jgi:hypothetical protein
VLRLTCANTMEEDILERTTYKKELGGAAIDGGMFNDQSTIEDRHAFLRKIFSRFESRMVHCFCPILYLCSLRLLLYILQDGWHAEGASALQ